MAGKDGIQTGGVSDAAPGEGADTRARILEAARGVFVSHPYQSAGLRMIAESAGVRHPLIIHYFGSKIALFEEIAQAMEAEILTGLLGILADLSGRTQREGFNLFINRMLEHGFRYPDAFKTIMLNVGETEHLNTSSPGLRRMTEVRRKTFGLLSDRMLGSSFPREADMLLLTLIISAANFVGSSGFHAKALGLSDLRCEYRQWVAEMSALVFMPVMETLSQGSPPPFSSLIEDKGSAGNAVFAPPVLRATDTDGKRPPQKGNKGEITRGAILKAARKVFASNPYDAASIRKIGRLGGFDYALIHHYFPVKADLFEAVAKEVFEEFVDAARRWGEGLEGTAFPQALARYLDKALSYCFLHREALGILMLNIGQAEHLLELEGFQYLVRFHSRIYEMVRPLLPVNAPERQLRMWLYALITVFYSFAGAPEYPAGLLGMLPTIEFYRRWILEALLTVFLPVFSKTQ